VLDQSIRCDTTAQITEFTAMRRTAIVLVILIAASSLTACSKCSVPTFGAQACNDKPAVR
jgi:hypothetical protein